jgi:uncharacterized SAM-binding protein YcdF (DUF218 family)
MQLPSATDAINTAVVVGYLVVAAWRAWENRRDHWTLGSWLGLGLVVVAGLAIVASGFAVVYAVDHHAAWVGAPGSDVRAGWIVVTMGTLAGGALGWAAVGETERQFPFIGSRIGSLPEGDLRQATHDSADGQAVAVEPPR